MENKYIINWELSLECNLDCRFCSQKERRIKQKNHISFNDASNIINNLPDNCHISFLWWETLTFPNILELFKLLENRWITYELTTNWILLGKFIKEIKDLNNLTQISISIDWFWDFHDISRWKRWIFDIIINVIPEIIKYKKISISTVITDISNKNLVKLYQIINKLKIDEQKIIYLMNTTEKDIMQSKKKIKELKIFTPWKLEINRNYKNEFIKKVIILKKIEDNTIVKIEPETVIKKWLVSCKQIDKQFRINEQWKISICEFIDNNFWDLRKERFEKIIKNQKYIELKKSIIDIFPLDICKNCCKLYILSYEIKTPITTQ